MRAAEAEGGNGCTANALVAVSEPLILNACADTWLHRAAADRRLFARTAAGICSFLLHYILPAHHIRAALYVARGRAVRHFAVLYLHTPNTNSTGSHLALWLSSLFSSLAPAYIVSLFCISVHCKHINVLYAMFAEMFACSRDLFLHVTSICSMKQPDTMLVHIKRTVPCRGLARMDISL